MTTPSTLCLSAHDELYIIDLSRVLYLQADDHYTHIYYTADTHFMVPFGLGAVEAQIAAFSDAKSSLIRLGRKYIVNIRNIFRISTIKESIYLADSQGGTVDLHIAKPVLRSLMDLVRSQTSKIL